MTAADENPQILPSAVDILRCVREVMRDLITPALAGGSERSAAATIEHMLRYVERLLADEGQALLDEEVKLKALLPGVADWLDGQPDGGTLAEALRRTCRTVPDSLRYPTLTAMEDRVALLRQHVCDALLAFHAAGEAKGSEGQRLHETLRAYTRWQIAKEGELVEPSFLGHGPRR